MTSTAIRPAGNLVIGTGGAVALPLTAPPAALPRAGARSVSRVPEAHLAPDPALPPSSGVSSQVTVSRGKHTLRPNSYTFRSPGSTSSSIGPAPSGM